MPRPRSLLIHPGESGRWTGCSPVGLLPVLSGDGASAIVPLAPGPPDSPGPSSRGGGPSLAFRDPAPPLAFASTPGLASGFA